MAEVAAPTHQFDLVLLGGGTGGYVAAIRAKQLGLNVAVVEELILGGCCLHRGCIPTKAFLKSADMFDDVKRAAEFGVDIKGDISFNYDTALSRSLKIVEGQYKGLHVSLREEAQDSGLHGPRRAARTRPPSASLRMTAALRSRSAPTRSSSTPDPARARSRASRYDGKTVIKSDHAVTLPEQPKSFIVRGGGATGVEWATVYHRYGIPTTLVGNLVPLEDHEIQAALHRNLTRQQKMDIIQGARPTADDIDVTKDGVTMRVKDEKGKDRVLQAEQLLVAIGREAAFEDIGLEEVGIVVENDFIQVDDMLQTNIERIYAIGDVNGQQLLAHTAMHHGIIAVEHIMGLNPVPAR